MFKKLLLLTATATALVGCGGTSIPEARPAAQIDGTAADNIIRNGNVRVYRFDGSEREILLTTKTDNYGYYADPLQSESQFIKVCVMGGEYTEEASSINIKLEDGDRLCAVTFWQSGQGQMVMVTPETNLATALIEYEVKQGKGNLQNIVSNANTKIGTIFGYDIITTKPADMTSDDLTYTGLNNSVRSGLWHAAFSRVALQAAIANGQKNHTSLISSMTLHKALYRDLAADGKLNGWGVAENGSTKVRLGLGTYELDAKVYRTELARELVKFVQSDRNKTAVKDKDVLAYATAHSLSTDTIWDDKDIPIPFDDDAPSVAFDTPENTYISGVYHLGVKVTDFSGVKSVTYTINGGNPQVFNFEQNVLTFNTELYPNGDLELALTVVDMLDNTAVVKRILRVSNQQPVVNIASKTLVNDANYSFKANVGEVKAGVASVEVQGRAADYANNAITATLRLTEGDNTISVKVVDLTGAEYAYNFDVVVDTAKPETSFKPVAWKALIKSNSTIDYGVLSQTMTSNRIFITPNYYSLGSVVVSEVELAAKSWPTYKLVIADAQRSSNYATPSEKLKIQLIYSDARGDFTYFTRSLKANEKGEVLIPVSEEYLGTKWYEKDEGKLVTITATDEAGNMNTYPLRFEVSVSSPSVNPPLNIGSNLKGTVLIDMDGRELQGTDAIRVLLDGTKETFLAWDNPAFSIDTTTLTDGVHYITVQITTGGMVLFEKRFEFNIDNTAPEIKFNSPTLAGTLERNYTLKGTVDDFGGSGISSLTGRHINNNFTLISNVTFEKPNLNLQSGDNEISVKAVDVAGNETTKILNVLHDDDAPRFQWIVKDGKFFDGSTTAPLYSTKLNVHLGYGHDPFVGGMFGNTGNPPFYLDKDNNNLQNLTPALVGGNANALNPDLSLNLSAWEAIHFLANGRGRGNHNIPHFDFTVADTQYSEKAINGEKGGIVVDATILKTYMTVHFNDELVVSRKELMPVLNGASTAQQQYYVPITKELFTNRLLNLQVSDKVKVAFIAEDEAKNSTKREYEFSVFNVPESTVKPTITGGLNTTITKDNLSLSLTAKSDIGLSRVSLIDTKTGATLDSWSSVGSTTKTTSKPLKTITTATEGSHSWRLEVVDLAGNITTQTYAGEIDKTAPTLNITGVPERYSSPFTLSWTVSDKNLSTVTANGQTVPAKNGSLTITPTGADGARTIKVVAVDKAGNSTEKTVNTYQHNIPKVTVEYAYFFHSQATNYGHEYEVVLMIKTDKKIRVTDAKLLSNSSLKFHDSNPQGILGEKYTVELSTFSKNGDAILNQGIKGEHTIEIKYLDEFNQSGKVEFVANIICSQC